MDKFVILLIIVSFATGCTSLNPSSTLKDTYSFALIGDMPYSDEGVEQFNSLIGEVNTDFEVEWVLHVGDIKSGGTSCSDAYLQSRLEQFQQFQRPFILIPGDNEWTDCHREEAGSFEPLERLDMFRSLFYPVPGKSLGNPEIDLTTQASYPSFSTYPEHVRWVEGNVVFVGLHILGSNNAMADFPGRTEADDQEASARMDAAIAWMKEAFEHAMELDSPGIFLMIHANPGFDNRSDQSVYHAFLDVLEQETVRFGRPVLLAHGDSHYFRIDKPMVQAGSGERIENFTRVETFGASDVHWLKVTVNPLDENVFLIEQRIVRL